MLKDMQNKVVGLTAMSGELLHAGHCQALEEARAQCDYLIVAFNVSPEHKTCDESVFERWTRLKGSRYVDEIIPYESEADLELIHAVYLPHVNKRFVGEDYKGKDFTGKKRCEDLGVEVIFTARKHDLSVTELKTRLRNKKLHKVTKQCDKV